METVASNPALRKAWRALLILLAGIVFFIVAVNLVSPVEYRNSDFFKFWLSGRFAMTGQNPYDSQSWIDGHHQFGAAWIPEPTFLYPLPASLLFVPFAMFPIYRAFIAWDILSQFVIALSLALLLKTTPGGSKRFILPLAAGVILFRPALITLVNGQLSGMLLLLTASIVYLWEKGRWEQGTVLLALLALKPNLGVPLIFLLALYLIRHKRIKSLLAGAACGVGLLIAGLAQNPNWLVEFWNTGNGKLSQTFGFSPTVWGVSTFFCNYNLDCVLGTGAWMSLPFLIGYLYLLAKRTTPPPSLMVGAAIVVVLLLTPYTWPYDQLLLVIPIATVMLNLERDGARYLPVSLIFLEVDVFALALLGVSAKVQLEIWNAAIPFVVYLLLFWYLLKDRVKSA